MSKINGRIVLPVYFLYIIIYNKIKLCRYLKNYEKSLRKN